VGFPVAIVQPLIIGTFPVADIFDREEKVFKKLGLRAECPGGGRIEHNPDKKYIKVYGYSQVGLWMIFNPTNRNLTVLRTIPLPSMV